MAAEGAALVRPRTTGELLDDAWRLAFADAPMLLLFSSVFLAPAFGALLLLTALSMPARPVLRLLLPLLPLTLLVLSGLGSAACQEWFRARAEGKGTSFTSCLNAAGRRGLAHAAARTAALIGPLLALGVWLTSVSLAERAGGALGAGALIAGFIVTGVAALPAFALWPFLATIHAFLASGKRHSLADLGEYVRQARYDPTKTAAVTLSRLALLVLVFVNLHLLIEAGLWVLSSLAGLDAAFVALQMTPANPTYDLALALLAWLLLAPFAEASNFLMHVDARTRQEGLDLQIRVQNVFPTTERRRVGALAVFIGVLFLGAGSVHAETVYDAVHSTRTAVKRIAGEAKAAEPYDGGRWEPELRQLAGRLEQSGSQSFGWFRARIKGFAGRNRNDALHVLDDLDQRLGLLEETLPRDDGSQKAYSKDDLKKLLQQPAAGRPVVDVRPEDEEDKPKEEEKSPEIKKEHADDESGNGSPHTVLITSPALGGCGPAGLLLLAGLALGVVGVGAVLFIALRNKRPPSVRAPLVAAKSGQQTTERHQPFPHERSTAELWREADEQARNEQFLQGARTLYLAVLSLLHRQQLLRFEPTRTNGEYLQQVRLAPQAPAELHNVFGEFTALFERKWYGDRACEAAEFHACRKLAEEMQTLVREM